MEHSEEQLQEEPLTEDLETVEECPSIEETEDISDESSEILNLVKSEPVIIGPDQIIFTTASYSLKPEDPVKLRCGGDNDVDVAVMSIPTLLQNAASNFSSSIALAWKRCYEWNFSTYRAYYANICTYAKAFIKLGLQRYHSVCILGYNSPEWFISYFAAILAGGISAAIPTKYSTTVCLQCARNSRANIIVVHNELLEKVLQFKDMLPKLKAIVQYGRKSEEPGIYNWNELRTIVEEETDDELNRRIESIAINQCCSIVFTPSAFGSPTGIMLSHDNLIFAAKIVAEYFETREQNEVFISYLPLSSVSAQISDIYLPTTIGATVYFSEENSVLQTLAEVHPTRFVGIASVWEKLQEKIINLKKQNSQIKKSIVHWAQPFEVQCPDYNDKQRHFRLMAQHKAAMQVHFRRIKALFGLDKCKTFMSIAKPLPLKTLSFFLRRDIAIMEAFGLPDTTGVYASGRNVDFKLETCGQPLPGTYTKFIQIKGEDTIYVHGRTVCMGYLLDKEKNEKTFDEENWLITEDKGYLYMNHYLLMKGRWKPFLYTAHGEHVPYIYIENLVKCELLCVSNAFLIGEGRPFLSILITLKVKNDPHTNLPTDELTEDVKEWCRDLGSLARTVNDVLFGPDRMIIRAIQEGMMRVNQKAFSSTQILQKFVILPREFSTEFGELTSSNYCQHEEPDTEEEAALEINCNAIQANFTYIIEDLYKSITEAEHQIFEIPFVKDSKGPELMFDNSDYDEDELSSIVQDENISTDLDVNEDTRGEIDSHKNNGIS